MKRKKNGFTLVELLAIIAILGLLAVFIVPKVKEMFNDSKEKIASENAKRLVGVFEEYYVKSSINDRDASCSYNFSSGVNTCNDLGITGDLPNDGYILVNNDGGINGYVRFGDYSFSIEDGVIIFLGNCNFKTDFTYTGSEESLSVPCSGYYKLEVWGASGGTNSINNGAITSRGGYGGYSTGTIYLKKGKIIYINVGGKGSTNAGTNGSVVNGGYNGGAACTKDEWAMVCNTSGGATHIALKSGQLYELKDYKGEYDSTAGVHKSTDILIVAGGGGAGGIEVNTQNGNRYTSGGSGGGYKGASGSKSSGISDPSAPGGTQTYTNGSKFGQANNGTGWYGVSGAGFYSGSGGAGGGGGSGYIGNSSLTNKIMYCYDCEESEGTETKTVSTTNTNNPLRDGINCSDGYANSPVSKCAKIGDGYAIITYLGN